MPRTRDDLKKITTTLTYITSNTGELLDVERWPGGIVKLTINSSQEVTLTKRQVLDVIKGMYEPLERFIHQVNADDAAPPRPV
jgi:hypothetical protein